MTTSASTAPSDTSLVVSMKDSPPSVVSAMSDEASEEGGMHPMKGEVEEKHQENNAIVATAAAAAAVDTKVLNKVSDDHQQHHQQQQQQQQLSTDGSDKAKPLLDHSFEPGDHLIRWEMLPIVWPIQIHAIVLEAGPDYVKIADFGLTTYEGEKGTEPPPVPVPPLDDNSGTLDEQVQAAVENMSVDSGMLSDEEASLQSQHRHLTDEDTTEILADMVEAADSLDELVVTSSSVDELLEASASELDLHDKENLLTVKKELITSWPPHGENGGEMDALAKQAEGTLAITTTTTIAVTAASTTATTTSTTTTTAAKTLDDELCQKDIDEINRLLASPNNGTIVEKHALSKENLTNIRNAAVSAAWNRLRRRRRRSSSETLDKDDTASTVSTVTTTTTTDDPLSKENLTKVKDAMMAAAREKLRRKEKRRLNVILITSQEELSPWKKVNYNGGLFGMGGNEEEGSENKDDTDADDTTANTEDTTASSPMKKKAWWKRRCQSTDSLAAVKDDEIELKKVVKKSKKKSEPTIQENVTVSNDEETPKVDEKAEDDGDDDKKKEAPKISKADPTKLVLARTKFLLEHGEKVLPAYDVLHANSECIAVWCKTGVWSTLQADVFLHSTAVANAKSATVITLGVVATAPLVASGLAGLGVVMVGLPWYILKKTKDKCGSATQRLTDEFWAQAEPEVFVECIEEWSALRS